ncbi:unnamed protein product [Mytilus edulis]|uniref:Uncharacterized protein n=1 Tax=Mytilus edulis TaxID=6550 RepID=A0A8S3U1D6_MYTED|nr:unnamed protein product [Mytilus edulis]
MDNSKWREYISDISKMNDTSVWKKKCLDTLTMTLQKTINYLEDLGADVSAWIVLPDPGNNSQIKHVGSKKGSEFILTKPTIDADLQFFLENYHINEKNEMKKASKKVLVDICIKLFDQKYAEALQKISSKFPYSLLSVRGQPWFTLPGFPPDLLPFRHPSKYDVHSLQTIINCKDLVKFNILHKKLQDAYYKNKVPCKNITKSALQNRLSGVVKKSQDQMDKDFMSFIEKDTATHNNQQEDNSKRKQRKEKSKCTNDLVVRRSKRRKTSTTKKYVSLLTPSCVSYAAKKKRNQKDQKLKPKTQDLSVTNTNENTFIMQIKEEAADPDDYPVPVMKEDDSNTSIPLNVSGGRSITKYDWESDNIHTKSDIVDSVEEHYDPREFDNNHTKSDIIDSVEMTCEEPYGPRESNNIHTKSDRIDRVEEPYGLRETDNIHTKSDIIDSVEMTCDEPSDDLPCSNYTQSDAIFFHSGLVDNQNSGKYFSCSTDSNNCENIMIKIEPIEH